MSALPSDTRKGDPAGGGSFAGSDTLATGIVFALGLTVVQRLAGFLRSILFCRFMDDSELGVWSLAFSFLILAAPLAVLGLPGTFGRYVEHYRQRGQFRSFLRRTVLFSGALGILFAVGMWLGQQWFAWIVFNDPGQGSLIVALAGALLAVIGFNFLVELLTAMRYIRAVTWMRFGSSILFAGLGILLIYGLELGSLGAIVAYGVGCGAVCLPAILVVRRCYASIDSEPTPLPRTDYWRKLAPFALWVWAINVLTNLFEMADRYMILHFAPAGDISAHSLVGQYHASRVVPMLMLAVAGLLAGVLLPYLSSDWESGHRERIGRRVNLSLKLVAFSFTIGGALVLIGSPLLFGWALAGKYDAGLAVLPWTLTYCVWFGLSLVAQTYLWCAEKAKLASIALLVGLVANVLLNCLLLPVWGLLGAVLATTVANGVALAGILAFNRRCGMRIHSGTWLAMLLPILLGFGALPATVVLAVLGVTAWYTDWWFDADEKSQLTRLIIQYLEKIRPLIRLPKRASA